MMEHSQTERADLIVTGGGAAGFFCAVNAARLHPGKKVVLLEKTGKVLSKVKVSGGGRCNVTHALDSVAELVKRYPRGGNFLKKSFSRFFVPDTIEWFAERGVTLKTEADGRMFPDTDDSQTIIDCLLREADRHRVQVRRHADVQSLAQAGGEWKVSLAGGATLAAPDICIAAGGYATADKFAYLTAVGHSIETPAPSLFTFNMPGNPVTGLMGVSVPEAAVRIAGSKLAERGPLLVTHWGMSGPAILRLSAWGARYLQEQQYKFTLVVNWLPDANEHMLRDQWPSLRQALGRQTTGARNPFGLPSRLWLFLLAEAGIPDTTRWAEIPAKEQNRLIRLLTAMEFPVAGKTTFKEEFVTCGGIRLSEIDPLTMQSRIAPGLYFAGEVMDVDGITGGFNFQHAWTSGWIAAQLEGVRP